MATGFTTVTDEHLRRANVWSRDLKSLLIDELMGMRFVRLLTDFPDGTTFNIPSVGEAETADFAEGQAIKYNRMDTGNFTFTFSQYKYSANSISAKFKRDSYWASDVEAMFVPRQHRALMEAVETRILSRGNSGQTASSLNTINGGDHRWVGGGTNETISLQDFPRARYSLFKANVPMTNLVAILDPSAIYALQTQTNVVNLLSPDPQWQGVVKSGAVTGMRFQFSLYGFDVYESNYLPGSIAETISGRTTTTAVANQFFSAADGDIKPIIGGFRQMPTVFSEFNKDLMQDEYVTIAEYDFKLYRPENMVVVLTDNDQVS
jgi:hypothetical protein